MMSRKFNQESEHAITIKVNKSFYDYSELKFREWCYKSWVTESSLFFGA